MKLRALTLVQILLAIHVSLSAEQQTTTFKAGTRTVAVYTTVTDQSGRLVPDLGREAFEVFDNGKRQDLTVFANDIQPITVVIMLDRSVSMRRNFTLVEHAAEQFVAAMRPEDKARIGSFSNRVRIDPEEFTSDKDALNTILRTALQPEGPTPLWNAVDDSITALLKQQGRRVVLVFTDGVDSPATFSYNNKLSKEVMKRADEEDVMVYGIGLAGQNAPFGSMGSGGRGVFGGSGRGGGGWGGGTFGQNDTGKPDEGLKKIAVETGGGYFELTSTDDLGATFRQVAEELHHQYVLGFSPAALDGKMHKLDVRVHGAAMTARARKSYRASGEAGTQ